MIFGGMRKYRLSVLWALFALFLCGVNGSSLPKISFDLFEIDKLAHMALFGIQAWIIYYEGVWKAKVAEKEKVWKVTLQAFLWSALYGALIEGLQMTVFVGRSFDWADMLADAIGALTVFVLYTWFRPKPN
jgi:VanZ family protein